MSTSRIDFYNASPVALKAMLTLEGSVGKLGLEPALLELVKMRASQINGCAFCLDMHSRDARRAGETERRLYVLAVSFCDVYQLRGDKILRADSYFDFYGLLNQLIVAPLRVAKT